MNIAILGAGSIGCYLAGGLLLAKQSLTIVARDALVTRCQEHGLSISDLNGNNHKIDKPIPVVSSSADCQPADVILITMKCHSLPGSLDDILALCHDNSVIVCLQNGFGAEQCVIDAFPKHTVLCGIVGFNVIPLENNQYQRSTDSEVVIEQASKPQQQDWIDNVVQAFVKGSIPARTSDDINAVRWGKLLLNINNSIFALAGIAVPTGLQDREFRRFMSAAIFEAVELLEQQGIKPDRRITKLPARLFCRLLTWPTPIFKILAKQMLAMAPDARPSMFYDIDANKVTEVDYINGAVVQLAQQQGRTAPINQALVTLIKDAEQAQQGSPRLSLQALRKQTGLA